MATFSSEQAEEKLLSKFHTPVKRKHDDTRSSDVNTTQTGSSATPITPVPLLPSAQEPSYLCQWRAPQTRKHKTWEGDAILILHGNKTTCSLRSAHDGSMLVTNAAFRRQHVHEGDEFYVAGKEIMVERPLTENGMDIVQPQNNGKSTAPIYRNKLSKSGLAARQRPIPASQFYSTPNSSSFSPHNASSGGSILLQEPHPRYNPDVPGAVVFKRPNAKHQELFGRNQPVVDVVLDPDLARILRPHQIEGVKFMYEAVTGISSLEQGHTTPGQGAILADEMGLGKTLQTIALIATLLRQNCYFSNIRPGTVEKVLIVCPLTLVVNWKREFRKWIGRSSIGVLAVEGDGRKEVERFVSHRQYQVLILGYERLRNCVQELSRAMPGVGLVVCDEGHRLKSKDTKTTKCFDLLPTRRRILLTGTPIQNDLREFYTMVDFVYPGLFDQYSVFKRIFEDPIMRSRQQYCTEETLELGKKRNKALMVITKGIILRRTADILKQYLPPRQEMALFCTMTPIQKVMYGIFSEYVNHQLLLGESQTYLPYITLLRQLCNSPELILPDAEDLARNPGANDQALVKVTETILQTYTASIDPCLLSGKFLVLHRILSSIRKHTQDRVIIVSNFTSTLNLLQRYCVRQKFPFLRLDGRTKADVRSKMVNEFNSDSGSDHLGKQPFVFLLSSKSGGVGLNLIGANRLILFDSDWNPATDRQAMARIHRDGQLKPCFIYRLLLVGSMDEKIYQRQITKIGLSDSLMSNEAAKDHDVASSSDTFSQEELRDVFGYHPNTTCLTHDLLGCACGGNGKEVQTPAEEPSKVENFTLPGFVSASKLPTENMLNEMHRKRLERQFVGYLHYDFQNHAQSFEFDDILQHVAERQRLSTRTFTSNQDAMLNDMSIDLSQSDHGILQSLVNKHVGYLKTKGVNEANGELSYVFIKPSDIQTQ